MIKAKNSGSSIRLPNALIIGAPKCGTTSLFNWLAEHPAVCPSSVKETYYFMDSDNPMLRSRPSYCRHGQPDNIHDHGLSRVSRYFEACSCSATIFLEATPHYLYQQTTPMFFKRVKPQPFIFILIRKPSSRIFSHFSYSQNNLLRIDPSVSFKEFTTAILDNNIKIIKDSIYDDQAYFWLKNQLNYSHYYEPIKYWMSHFDSDRVMTICFEDMIANPIHHLKKISHKLNISAQFYDEFDFSNRRQSVTIRNKKLRRVLRISKQHLKQIAPNFPSLSSIEKQLKSIKLQTQLNHVTASTLDCESIHRLDEYFQPHNQKLIDKLGVDLARWNH